MLSGGKPTLLSLEFRMTATADLSAAMAICPLVAILRGVRPDEVEAVADQLVEAGFSMIEVPLNSPQPLDSIARLVGRYGPEVMIGAGTVLTVADVEAVKAVGGRLIVSPNVNTDVIRASAAAGMISLPGFFTASEAFAALDAGATGLKLFPAEGASPLPQGPARGSARRDAAAGRGRRGGRQSGRLGGRRCQWRGPRLGAVQGGQERGRGWRCCPRLCRGCA
jgi:hypothetical protein